MIGYNEWEDPQVTVVVTVNVVKSMHERYGAAALAERLVREALPPVREPTNWQGDFIIVREIKAL